jgi:murein DD-endopeptidase MepM/ murein hydrolase activator NlpD
MDYEEQPLDEMAVMQEPPFDPEDTSPTGVFRRSEVPKTNPRNTDRISRPGTGPSWLNWVLSGAALLITIAAGIVYLQQNNTPPTPPPTQVEVVIEATIQPTDLPTLSPTQPPGSEDAVVPLDVVAEVLAKPADTAPPADRLIRQQTAYTIAPVRPRASNVEYTIRPGDTLDKISERFGVSKETIAWANDDKYVNLLQPGDKLIILPANGVLYKTKSDETIQSIAVKYKVSPYAIIDSEYNKLQNTTPDVVLPPELTVMVPGGVSDQKPLYWNPPVKARDKAGNVLPGNGLSNNPGGEVSFGGGPGSCGYEPNAGGGPLRIPLARYNVVRGFYPGHTGIDLQAPTGTPVFAAANGTVIFAGWSNWGYGNSIVLAHGSMFTLYGHLSAINVRCGQQVSAGTPIGAVGSTGNSSGPHLHFEIRPNGVPVNPVQYLAF